MLHVYLDHIVATLVTFTLLLILERIIHRDEPDHTVIELFITAIGVSITIPLTFIMIIMTYVTLLIRKQPNALTRASYWPVELLRLITRRNHKQHSV
ncbi:hypothetical protein AH06_39 [Erwinia phage AH06]|nr:hypothetical protein AH06_39 [Erwinia phage AH06]